MKLITGNIILALLCAQPGFSATVDVSVHGLTSRNGFLNVSIWKNVKGFPKKSEEALAQKIVPVAGSDMTIRFDALEQGVYAVVAYHDQNSNGKLDMGFMGPKEPYGVSNNFRSKFGPPDFESCAFNLSDKLQVINILVK
jgi:uncharacterized protein (DUF2141 family)